MDLKFLNGELAKMQHEVEDVHRGYDDTFVLWFPKLRKNGPKYFWFKIIFRVWITFCKMLYALLEKVYFFLFYHHTLGQSPSKVFLICSLSWDADVQLKCHLFAGRPGGLELCGQPSFCPHVPPLFSPISGPSYNIVLRICSLVLYSSDCIACSVF